MPLDKATLVTTLTGIFGDLSAKTAAQKAQEVADAIDVYVKTGTVTIAIDLGSTANGVTAGAASAPVTGTGTGTIS